MTTENAAQATYDEPYSIDDEGPWRECGHERGKCQCGGVWDIASDTPVCTVEIEEWGDRMAVIREGENGPEARIEMMAYGHIAPHVAKARARLIAQAPAMALVLRLLLAGRADWPGLGLFRVWLGTRETPAPPMDIRFTGDYTALLDAIGWDRARAALEASE